MPQFMASKLFCTLGRLLQGIQLQAVMEGTWFNRLGSEAVSLNRATHPPTRPPTLSIRLARA